MSTTNFWKELFLHISVPFEIEDVKEISSNCGTTWIDMKDGSTYYISIERAEVTDRE
jgi:coenzyme F420-reducing hydrogenase beta subunit